MIQYTNSKSTQTRNFYIRIEVKKKYWEVRIKAHHDLGQLTQHGHCWDLPQSKATKALRERMCGESFA